MSRRLRWCAAFDGSYDPASYYLAPTLLTRGWLAWIAQCGMALFPDCDGIVHHGAQGWRPNPVKCGLQWDGSPAMVNPCGMLDLPENAPARATFVEGMLSLRKARPDLEQIVYIGGPSTTMFTKPNPALFCAPLLLAKVSVCLDVFGDAWPCTATEAVIDYLITHGVKLYLENHTARTNHYPKIPRISSVGRARLVQSGSFLSASENIVWMQSAPVTDYPAWQTQGWTTAGVAMPTAR